MIKNFRAGQIMGRGSRLGQILLGQSRDKNPLVTSAPVLYGPYKLGYNLQPISHALCQRMRIFSFLLSKFYLVSHFPGEPGSEVLPKKIHFFRVNIQKIRIMIIIIFQKVINIIALAPFRHIGTEELSFLECYCFQFLFLYK